MPIDRSRLQAAYARLKGFERATPFIGNTEGVLGRDFNAIVSDLSGILDEDLGSYQLGVGSAGPIYPGAGGTTEYCRVVVLRSKMSQLVSYLELTHHLGTEIVEIGTLYNSIQDGELRDRCADLLSAPGNFDRVINQATLVLEDRIRNKSGQSKDLSGTQLVNEVLNSDSNRTVLKVSDDAGDMRAFVTFAAALC